LPEKMQSMPIIKIDDIRANEQDIYLVRRAQAKLALQTDFKNLYEYYQRDSFQRVAKYLVEKYWTQSVHSGRAIIDLVTELYIVWLALLPIACRTQGYYRPGWGSSIFLSWFRAHINKYGRYHIGRIPLSWHNPVLQFSSVGISDSAFQDLCSEYLSHCRGHTALPMFARLIFGPFVFPDPIKQAVDTAKNHNCGIMWWEDEILFLSTKTFDFPGLHWHDLRVKKQDVLHWTISVEKGKLQALVRKQIIKDIKNKIESVIKSDSTPAHKMVQINIQLKKFYFVAKYTAQASRQAVDLDKWAWNKVAKSIIATKPELKKSYYSLRSQDWDTNFRVGRKSLFLDRDVTLQTWVSMWAPRR